MPELPEVQTIVDGIRATALGCVVTGLGFGPHEVVRPSRQTLAEALLGQKLTAVRRRGKRIVLTFQRPGVCIVHLGMTGRLLIASPADPPPPHTHVTLRLHDGRLLRFADARRFGGVVWCDRGSPLTGRFAGHLGPEPLTLSPERLRRRLMTTRRPIKSALLDQSLVAGLGNIYVDEALHHAGIHPLTPAIALDVPAVRRLNRSIKRVLRRAIRAGGSTLRDYVDASGVAGTAQLGHRVYARVDQPCRRCQTPIVRVVLGGRSTHFCPGCQPSIVRPDGRAVRHAARPL